jgi:hypothetical protein
MSDIIVRWKPITGYDGLYEVSDVGEVRSLPRKCGTNGWYANSRLLKQSLRPAGYYLVNLTKNRVQKTVDVHLLVARAFIPGRRPGLLVDHINEVRTDNKVTNLRWATKSQNMHNTKNGWGGMKYRGTHYVKRFSGWVAYITVSGKRRHLGCFKKREQALRARIYAEKNLLGQFARVGVA